MLFSSTFSFYLKLNEKSTVKQLLFRVKKIDIYIFLDYNDNTRCSMKKLTKSKKKRLNYKIVLAILILILVCASVYLLHTISLFKNIETPLRICASILILDIIAIFTTLCFKIKKKRNIKLLAIFAVVLILYSGIIAFGSMKVKNIYSSLSNMSNTKGNINTHSTSIIVTKKSPLKNIDDAKKGFVGVIKEEGNVAVYELPMQIIKKEKFDTNKIKYYDNYVDLLHDLLEEKIDAAFVPTQYTVMYASEEFETLKDDTKIIYTQDQEEKEEEKVPQKSLDEPFTILIMGVDTTGNGIGSSFNGDALLLVTFNPKTMNSTILSIPRDSYIPISCMNNRKNKITNAGWQGESCIMQSIENYFGIKIDYHFKINFNGVVSLVDALGGVDVDVPYSFCEQNSERKWGKNTIFVKEGMQHLNGEQALAFARHRKVTSYQRSYCGAEYTEHAGYWNDFIRGQNQQVIIRAMLNKIADIKSFDAIQKLLDTISDNAKTNMSTETILSLYNLGKNILSNSNSKSQMLNMQRLYLSGYDAYIYDYSFLHSRGSKLTTYNFVIYDKSYEEVVHAMKVNLELEKATPVKTFSFSVHDEYEQTVIGKGSTSARTLVLMPNFVGTDVSKAKEFANKNGINLVIDEVEGKSYQFIGQVLSQDIPEKTDISMMSKSKTLKLTVVSSKEQFNPEPPEEDPSEEEPNDPIIPGTPDDEENDTEISTNINITN